MIRLNRSNPIPMKSFIWAIKRIGRDGKNRKDMPRNAGARPWRDGLPSYAVCFLAKNSSNNLHINKLFIISLLFRGRRSRASRYTFSADGQGFGRLFFSQSVYWHGQLRPISHFSTSATFVEGGCALRRHTTWKPTMPVCRRTFSYNPNMNVTI